MNCTRTELEGSVCQLRITGSLDALTVRDIRPVVDAVVADNPKRVTIDLAELSMIDSSGVGALVSLFKRIKAAGGEVLIVSARDQPLAVLKLLKLDKVLGL